MPNQKIEMNIPKENRPADTSSGTLYLILIQVASRGLTFFGNQFLLRFLSPELLGIAVQLELFSVSVLYFSRESLRVALQRSPQEDGYAVLKSSKAKESQVVVNFSYIAIALGLPLTIFLGYQYLHNAGVEVSHSPNLTLALQIYALATIIELLAEPSFVILQQRLLYKSRARSETLAAILKCLTACSAAFISQKNGYSASVLPFALGQLSYAVVLFINYARTSLPLARAENFSLRIQNLGITNSSQYLYSRFSRPLLSLTSMLYAQSIFKQILTQGDAYIFSIFAPLSDQGAFALASNYGGLIARLFFQPIEEDSRNVFGRLLSSSPSPSTTSTDANEKNTPSPSAHSVTTALARLTNITHMYTLLALPCTTILPFLLPALVRLLIGPTWFTPSISATLRAYSYYIPLMGLNGILDAFVTSTATPSQLRNQSLWMAGFTGIYIAAAGFFLRSMGIGAQGLVCANMINMGMRIVWGGVWIYQWTAGWDGELEAPFTRFGTGVFTWREGMPSGVAVVGTMGVGYALCTVLKGNESAIYELQVLCIACVVLGVVILICEYTFIRENTSQFLPRRVTSTIDFLEAKASNLLSKRLAPRNPTIKPSNSSAETKKSR